MFFSLHFSLLTKMLINVPVIVRQRKFNIQKKNNPFSVLIRSIIQKLLKELDPGTVSCLPMNSVLSPLTVDGSTCFLLLNHMKLLPLRSAKAMLLFFIVFYFSFFSHSSCGFSRFPAAKLIKQKLASGPTGTEKLNRFLYSAHTIWFKKYVI